MSNMPIRMHGLDQNPIFNPGLPKDQKPVLFHLQDFQLKRIKKNTRDFLLRKEMDMKNIQQKEEKLQRDFILRKNKIMDMKNNIQQKNLSASQLRKVRYFSSFYKWPRTSEYVDRTLKLPNTYQGDSKTLIPKIDFFFFFFFFFMKYFSKLRA